MFKMDIIILVLIPLLWNILTVSYLSFLARKGKLSPTRFSLVLILGFSVTVSAILFIVITRANGVNLQITGRVLIVFLVNFVIGFPIVYLVTKIWLNKVFIKWSSQLKATRRKHT